MPHPLWVAVSLEPEKTFPVNVCYSQCVSASCFEFHKMFYVKKNYYLWSSFPFPLVTCITRSSCMQSSLLCILSFLYQIMMCFVFSTFFFFFQYLKISMVYILFTGFSWTFTCSSYSYPLASTTLAEVTASASSRAQTTSERARVIWMFRQKNTEMNFNQEELQWLYHVP